MVGEGKVVTKKSVSLSHQTIARRVSNLTCITKSKEYNRKLHTFSLVPDESLNISDTKQLLVFIRTVDDHFTKMCYFNKGPIFLIFILPTSQFFVTIGDLKNVRCN